MKLTKVKRIIETNGSGLIRYSAVIDGEKLVQHTTDNVFHPHLTRQEWIDIVKSSCYSKNNNIALTVPEST